MLVDITEIVEADAMVDAVGLCLCFKAECTVLDALCAATEIRLATEEITGVELYAGLVGVYVKYKFLVSYTCNHRKAEFFIVVT